MAEISIGAAVGAGFGLIRRRPVSVLAWGLIQVGFAAGFFAMMGPFYIKFITSSLQAGPAGPDMAAMMPNMIMMQGLIYLYDIVSLLLTSILYCAVFRAVLHPERRQFAYLRVGAPELFTALLTFAAAFVFVIALMVVMIPLAIVIGILVSNQAVVAAVITGVVAAVVLMVVGVVVGLRFVFVVPMMVQDGKFHLFESWTATKGHVGRLFLIGLALVGIVLIAEFIIGALLLAIGAGALGLAAGGFGNLQAFFGQGPAPVWAKLAPFMAIFGVIAIPIYGFFFAIAAAPWAKAYRDLLPHPAQTFA